MGTLPPPRTPPRGQVYDIFSVFSLDDAVSRDGGATWAGVPDRRFPACRAAAHLVARLNALGETPWLPERQAVEGLATIEAARAEWDQADQAGRAMISSFFGQSPPPKPPAR